MEQVPRFNNNIAYPPVGWSYTPYGRIPPRNAPSLGFPSLSVVGPWPVPARTLVWGYSRSLDASALIHAGSMRSLVSRPCIAGASSEPLLALTMGGWPPGLASGLGLTAASAGAAELQTVLITVSEPPVGRGVVPGDTMHMLTCQCCYRFAWRTRVRCSTIELGSHNQCSSSWHLRCPGRTYAAHSSIDRGGVQARCRSAWRHAVRALRSAHRVPHSHPPLRISQPPARDHRIRLAACTYDYSILTGSTSSAQPCGRSSTASSGAGLTARRMTCQRYRLRWR